jgi:hypothetical protein
LTPAQARARSVKTPNSETAEFRLPLDPPGRMAAKRALLELIGQAADAGDDLEVERLWAEVDRLYEPGFPVGRP